jgi:ABC-type nitrate/sulfonate/bicarbonate transport system substrate-binding protein
MPMPRLSRRHMMELSAATALGLGMRSAFAATAPVLGVEVNTWGAIGLIADKLKLFQKYGSGATLAGFDSGTAVRDALVAERIDIGVVAVSTFITAVDKGQAVAIACNAYAGHSNRIMIPVASTIKTVADLKGLKVASQLGAGSDYTFRTKVLPKFGLTDKDIHLVNVRYQDHVASLASGSVDAFVGSEPFPSVAEYDKIAKTLVDFSAYDLLPIMLVANRDYVAANPDEVVKFLRGWLASVELFQKDPAQAAHIIWSIFKDHGFDLAEEVVRSSNDRLGVNPNFVRELPTYLTEQAQQLLADHKISAMPDWSKAVDPSYLQKAQKA